MGVFMFRESVKPATRAQEAASREAGFSLVELMVVITIIGVLAGIAVPRFQTFRARSAQSEAKSGLNGLFLSMQSYEANYGNFCVTAANGTCAANPAPGAAGVATGYANAGAAGSQNGTSIPGVGFALAGNQTNYQYSLKGDLRGWSAMAASRGRVGANFDYVRINTNKWVCMPFDGVTDTQATAPAAGAQSGSGTQCPQQFAGANNTTVPATVAPADCPAGVTAANCLTN